MVVADSGNGLSGEMDFAEWLYINTDLTVHLFRPPAGEWICVDARSLLDAGGTRLAATVLYDASGQVGLGAQALLVGLRV